MSDTLSDICAKKREHVAARKAQRPEGSLLAHAQQREAPLGFRRALESRIASGSPALIAEIKKASPSKGLIREDFDPATLAQAYRDGGATCLSVLTDEPYFQGADAYLATVKTTSPLPVLRKDFMVDPYQIVESRALGADCVLLIMAALSDMQAREMHDLALSLGMDVLVEVHDREEIDRAAELAPALLGVNNRSLKTLKVDISVSEALSPHIPASSLRVAESGISTHDEITRLQGFGYHTFLVGESLMRQPDVTAATQRLLGHRP